MQLELEDFEIVGISVRTTNQNQQAEKDIETLLRSTYRVFISGGPLPSSVQETWLNIWKSDLKRRYTADFDVYGPHSTNPNKAVVRTFVSIE